MADQTNLPQDDLIDVLEMTNNIESYLNTVLRDNEKNLAISALISASINCMFAQCKTLNEILFYRNIFVEMLDSSIRTIKVQKSDKPTSS